jgi:hypothetical protein
LASDTSAANLPPPISGLARQKASLTDPVAEIAVDFPSHGPAIARALRQFINQTREIEMKLPFLGLCVAGAAAIMLQTGTTTSVSPALAQEAGCIKTDIALHEKRCPTDVAPAAVAPAESSSEDVAGGDTEPVEPVVTPTASTTEGCIKTEILMHERRCPDGV